MKKLLAIILVLTMLLCCTGTALAVDSQKISKESLEIIENASDDELITIFLNVRFDEEFYNNMGYVVAKGYDTEKYYTDPEYKAQCDKEWRAYVEDFKAQNLKEMMELYHEVFGDDTENLLDCLDLAKTMMIKATKAEILAAAESPKVSSLYVYTEMEVLPGEANRIESIDELDNFCKTTYVTNRLDCTSNDEIYEHINVTIYNHLEESKILFKIDHMGIDVVCEEVFDNYIWVNDCIHSYDNPTGVYVTDILSGGLWTLNEAYENGWIKPELLVHTVPYICLIGDGDGDTQLTVRDATYIQKCIAGLNTPKHLFQVSSLIYDFNRDQETNIKDATAIQKYIAGIE